MRTQRSWDFTLRSFSPAGQFRHLRFRMAGGPRVVHPSSAISCTFASIILSRYRPLANLLSTFQTCDFNLGPIGICRVRLLGFNPSVPACWPMVARSANLCCPGLCLSRACRTRVGATSAGSCAFTAGFHRWTGGSRPATFIGRRRSASGGSPLLSLARRLRALPWTTLSGGPKPASASSCPSAIQATDA